MSLMDSRRSFCGACRRLRFFAPFLALALGTAALGAPADENQVIVPKSASTASSPASSGGTGTGALTAVGVIVLAGAGGWLLLRGRNGGLNQFSRAPRQLTVEETRSLGNRQYLVVASYQDKKFLIGVCPGQINMLSPLDSTSGVAAERARS